MIIQRAKSEVWMFCYTRFSIRNQKMASNASQRKSYKSLEEIHLNPQGSKQGLEVGNYWKGFLTFLLENKSFCLRNIFFFFSRTFKTQQIGFSYVFTYQNCVVTQFFEIFKAFTSNLLILGVFHGNEK